MENKQPGQAFSHKMEEITRGGVYDERNLLEAYYPPSWMLGLPKLLV